MSLLDCLQDRIKYIKTLINPISIKGAHDSSYELRGDLGLYMKRLKDSEHGDEEVDIILKQLHSTLELETSFADFKNQYGKYLLLLSNREDRIDASQNNWWYKLDDVPNLKSSKWNFWGSIKQLHCGKLISDSINEKYSYNLHPIWGSLLNPTGGIVGAGNNELINMRWNSFISLHGCVHDACGYLFNYHNIGCGYNYLNTYWTLFPKSSPMSCQFAGIWFWEELLCNN